MGTFNASLKAVGDTRGLDATVHVKEGRLSISAGDTPIGEWEITEVALEPIPTGYRMSAEGDQIIIELQDVARFTEAIEDATPKKRSLGRKPKQRKSEAPTPTERAPKKESRRPRGRKAKQKPADAEPPVLDQRVAVAEKETTPTAPPAGEDGYNPNAVVKAMDNILDKAEKRWGNLLPAWVFSRGAFIGGLLLVIAAVVFPGLTSTITLIAGLVALVLGGVAYSDEVLAAKWMPGRATPVHILLAGVGLIVIAIFFGIIAR